MEEKRSWFKRHWILTTVLVVIILLLIFGVYNSSKNNNSDQSEKGLISNDSNSQSVSAPVSNPIWHTVTNFSGTGNTNTDSFQIQGGRFRLTYSANPENEYSLFSLLAYHPGSDVYTDTFSLNSGGTQSSISYSGAGEYYLKIISANMKSWNVQVEDYY